MSSFIWNCLQCTCVKLNYLLPCSLSVTKWIHVNWGDDGLITLFAEIWKLLWPVSVMSFHHTIVFLSTLWISSKQPIHIPFLILYLDNHVCFLLSSFRTMSLHPIESADCVCWREVQNHIFSTTFPDNYTTLHFAKSVIHACAVESFQLVLLFIYV